MSVLNTNISNDSGEWLEDSTTGRFSRITTTPEESTWVCNVCGEGDADPYEDGCTCCGADADTYLAFN
ncbi:primase-helicase zinc-binding domain-containing protein [Methylomonas sp. Kb3]|uniref:primase-helicase zinc-binding domain-containing protein n=1 Tax=Methylomonas sp. Kb3 TaxID=1611544 RepID=UPI00105525E7|nr:primase-helicase zinc-binding domain-containing protein [Methylomonas sp. Kb3]